MAYTPTTWATGDTVNATKLNKLEQGVANAGSALIVTSSLANGEDTMDKTVQEIYDALISGTPVYYKYIYATTADYYSHAWLAPITYIYTYGGAQTVRVCVSRPMFDSGNMSLGFSIFVPSIMVFTANSMNSYPTFAGNIKAPLSALEKASSIY